MKKNDITSNVSHEIETGWVPEKTADIHIQIVHKLKL